MGSFSLVYHFLSLYFTGGKCRSTDWILKHVTLAKLLVVHLKGIPETLAALESKQFTVHQWDLDAHLLFMFRVSRDVSIGTIFLLSVFQMIIVPSDSRWAELKRKAPKYVGIFSILCWIFSMILSILVSFYVTAQWNNTSNTENRDHGYCYLCMLPQGHRCETLHQEHRSRAQNQGHFQSWLSPFITFSKAHW